MKKVLLLLIVFFLSGCQSKINLQSNTDFYILDDTTMFQFEYKDTVQLIEKHQYTAKPFNMNPSRVETKDLYFSSYREPKRSNQIIFNKTDFSTKVLEKEGYAHPIVIGNHKLFYVYDAANDFIIQRVNMDSVIEKEVNLNINGIASEMIYDNGKIYLLLRHVVENKQGDYDAYVAEIVVMNEELEVIERRHIETSKVGYIDLIKVKDKFYLTGWYKASAVEYIPANVIMAYNWDTGEKSYIELETESPKYFVYDSIRNVLLVMHDNYYVPGNKVTQIDLDTLEQTTIIFDSDDTKEKMDEFFVKIHHDKYYVLLFNKLCVYDTKTKKVETIDLTKYGISKANTLIFP